MVWLEKKEERQTPAELAGVFIGHFDLEGSLAGNQNRIHKRDLLSFLLLIQFRHPCIDSDVSQRGLQTKLRHRYSSYPGLLRSLLRELARDSRDATANIECNQFHHAVNGSNTGLDTISAHKTTLQQEVVLFHLWVDGTVLQA